MSALPIQTVVPLQTARPGDAQTHQYFYRFPENSILRINSETSLDISGIGINLSEIFIGGIGYGGGGSKLLARTMADIGSEGCVCNAPFCLEAYGVERGISVISFEDNVMDKAVIQSAITKAIQEGCTHFNIPLNLDGHTSLVAIVVKDERASLRFYDSLPTEICFYENRYNETLIGYIRSLLPSSLSLSSEKPEVLHLLSQGGADSAGCGYYALYTALLLKEDEEIRNLASFHERPLLDETEDKKIRAHLVVRSLFAKGVDSADTSYSALSSQSRDYLYNRIGFALKRLVHELKPRIRD